MSALGHSATSAGHALMSERGAEPDIEPRHMDVAEVPKADIQVARFTFSMSLRFHVPSKAGTYGP